MWWIIGGVVFGLVAWTWVRSGALADQDMKRILENQKKFEGEEDIYEEDAQAFLRNLDQSNEKVLGRGYNRSLAVKAAQEPDEIETSDAPKSE